VVAWAARLVLAHVGTAISWLSGGSGGAGRRSGDCGGDRGGGGGGVGAGRCGGCAEQIESFWTLTSYIQPSTNAAVRVRKQFDARTARSERAVARSRRIDNLHCRHRRC